MRTGADRGSEPRASGAGSTPNRRERFAMRYRKDQKQATRQRLLEAAGRRFKQDGIDGAGVATVMSDAGLTNGAFYNHFTSKEDLVANVLADQLHAQRHSFDAQPHDRLIGPLQLARALTDRHLSDQLLARGVETALKLLDDRA